MESRIAALRGQVRRLLALHGLSWVLGSLVLAAIVAGLADWLVHLSSEVRLAELLVLAGLGIWLALRYVVAPLVVRFRDLDIALRIEQRWPGLNDRLASTVQFLKPDPLHGHEGSPALREATVRETVETVKSLDFREAIDPRPARRALGFAVGAIALCAVFFGFAPGLSRIAIARLIAPYGSARWPQLTHLKIVEAARKVARGDAFNLAVAVAPGERMPASARVTYRFPDGETATEPMREVEGGMFRGRIEAVSRSFMFWVAAGDDVTEWNSVEVVPPPAIESLTIHVAPPAYTALAPQTLAPGRTQIRSVEGTRVEIEAKANKPLADAAMHRGDSGAVEPVTLGKGRLRFSTAFTVASSDPFWFSLRDSEGFRNQEAVRYEVRSIKDEAPRVVFEEPDSDRDVPPTATVPVRITADDDFGVQSVRLIYRVASGSPEPTQLQARP
ncbi:MAG TPA: DUF4175 family protein, partial [Isosphaeraceae bacterium]|nr:DUF4175 family protein [Isosphaeraceae bacterium]